MRSRRDSIASDNLGLLLDAICNTFGAVLLIAILVAVLLSTSAKELIPSEEQLALLETLNNEKDRQISLKNKRDKLRLILKDFKSIEDDSIPEHREESVSKIKSQISQLRNTRDRLETNLKAVLAKPKDLKDEKQAMEKRIKDAEAELRMEIEKRTEIARLPVLESDSNEQIPVLIRYDRFYLTHAYNDQGERIGINTNDMILKTNTEGDIEARAKPTAGVVIDTVEGRRKIKQIMRIFNPQMQSVVLFTGRASFDSYRPVAEMLIDMGFNIFPWPMTDEGVWDRGGEGGVSQ